MAVFPFERRLGSAAKEFKKMVDEIDDDNLFRVPADSERISAEEAAKYFKKKEGEGDAKSEQ